MIQEKQMNKVSVRIERKMWIHQDCILSIFLCRNTIVIFRKNHIIILICTLVKIIIMTEARKNADIFILCILNVVQR